MKSSFALSAQNYRGEPGQHIRPEFDLGRSFVADMSRLPFVARLNVVVHDHRPGLIHWHEVPARPPKGHATVSQGPAPEAAIALSSAARAGRRHLPPEPNICFS